MRRSMRIGVIAAILGLAVLVMPRAGGGQDLTEHSMSGIRAATKTKSIISYCKSLGAAMEKMTAAVDAFSSLFGTATPNTKGSVGEDIVSKALGIKKNTTSYADGSRIPDFRDGNTKWYEVKNVKRQGWSRQIRDTWKAAAKNGDRTYSIITRYDTKLSERLLREVKKRGGRIRIIKCLPPIT